MGIISRSLYQSAAGAVRPWNGIDAKTPVMRFQRLPQQDIDVCLKCRYATPECDRCDGKGNLSNRPGHPRAEIDTDKLRELMRLKRCNRECCAVLGVSATTVKKYKRMILKEEML